MFIEVTELGGNKRLVNVSQVTDVGVDGTRVYVTMSTENVMVVKETYGQVRTAIQAQATIVNAATSWE